ncbi:MAG: FeoA family protein [Cloacibacillus sp.]
MMPLAMAGEAVGMIKKISGNGAHRQFIENMGFVPGAEVTIVSKNSDGMIVSIKGARIAINNDVALKIYI